MTSLAIPGLNDFFQNKGFTGWDKLYTHHLK